MIRVRWFVVAAGIGLAVLSLGGGAEAQIGSMMRGTVTTTDGQPLPDVNVEFVFKGESRVPIVKKTKTDKKGQYARVGLQTGEWAVTFTKEGFALLASPAGRRGGAVCGSRWSPHPSDPTGQKTAGSAAEGASACAGPCGCSASAPKASAPAARSP